jgi:hypothetical protein
VTETSRREFLVGVAAGSIASSVALNTSGTFSAGENTGPLKARRSAVNRRRRVIYNNDGDDIWAKGADTVDKFLAVRHTPLLNTHVDSIHYCTTQSFNHFTHDTRIAEMFRAKSGKFAGNNLQKFLDQKTDGLKMSSEFARKNGLESIWTLRMNDIHDAWTAEFLPEWKRQDPTRVMSTFAEAKDFNDRRRLWSLVDFEHPDVHARLVAIIEEVLQNYDVDGVELDFMRAPFYFRTGYMGQPASEAQIEILTRLIRIIRHVVLKECRNQGKPLLLTARVPSTVALCRRIGIDIESWLDERLLDTMSLGGGYVTYDVPVAELIAQGRRCGVPVYPCLSQSGLMQRPPRGTSTKQPPEAWFGAAARLWADGASGIYSFNLFPGPGTDTDRDYVHKVLTTIGAPEKLQASTIQYAMSDAGSWMPSHYWAKDAADYSRALPLTLKPDEFTQTYMIVPDDLRGSDISVTAEVRLDFTGLSKDSEPTILFGSANFGPQTDGQEIAGVRRFICRVPLQAISKGRNRVMVKVAGARAKLVGVELWIKRP